MALAKIHTAWVLFGKFSTGWEGEKELREGGKKGLIPTGENRGAKVGKKGRRRLTESIRQIASLFFGGIGSFRAQFELFAFGPNSFSKLLYYTPQV